MGHDDYKNGNACKFVEVDHLMQLLLAHDESHFHAPDAEPPYMVPMTKWVKANGFYEVFPGGAGVLHETERFPKHGVLILAHNYDSEHSYRRAVEHGYTATNSATFARVMKLMSDATEGDFDATQCFLSNRFMGVRRVTLDENGKEPKLSQYGSVGTPYRPYLDLCATILNATVELMQPSVIITLGKPAAISMGRGKTPWSERGVFDVVINGHSTKLACVTHTGSAQYVKNVKSVRYGRHEGLQAEIALMRDAWNAFRDAERIRTSLLKTPVRASEERLTAS